MSERTYLTPGEVIDYRSYSLDERMEKKPGREFFVFPEERRSVSTEGGPAIALFVEGPKWLDAERRNQAVLLLTCDAVGWAIDYGTPDQ